jgi:DNA-binding PadR family transcriptional regulator
MDERITRAIIGALREGDRSGHELWKWLGPIHGEHEELNEASLYPILYRLEAERVIRGEWREVEPTRRAYRVAARGVELAAGRGWPVVAHRQEPDPILTPGIEMPRASAATAAPSADPAAAELAADAAQSLIRDYVSRVDAGLRLSASHRTGTRIEIGDHLQDCVEDLVGAGFDPVAAATEATARLGPPEVLAEAASKVQLTRRRLLDGMRSGGYRAVLTGGVALAGGALVVLLTPLISRFLTTMALGAGLHVYMPETVQWRDQQNLAAVWVAVFMAARRSTPRVATESRRAESAIRPVWAVAGVAPLALVALLAPVALDSLTVIGLLGVPIAFVVGVWRFQGPIDDPASKRGVAQATLLLTLFLFLPGFRVWVFDPATIPHDNPSAALSTAMEFRWYDNLEGTSSWYVSVSGLDPAVWHDAQIEFWPTARQGPTIAPDPGATHPSLAISPGERLDLATLPDPTPDWWVTLTATGSDGQRRTLLAEVHPGAPPFNLDSLLGWALGQR